jgi:hypothetical protein
VWTVIWYPHRSDHPDAPSLTIESSSHTFPTDGGADRVLEWAEEYFRRRDPRDFAEILVESFATHDEVAAIERAFDEAGFPVIVNPALEFRSADPELIQWSLVVKAPLTVFLTAIATRAAGDVYDGLRSLIKWLAESRGGRAGSVAIEEADRTVVLATENPDDALRQLADGKVPESGYVVWDDVSKVWRRH